MLATLSLLFVAASAMAQTTAGGSTLMINTPAELTECQPTQLKWQGGSGPYYLAAIPGGQVSAAPLEQFGEMTGTSYTWTVNIQSGTSVTLSLTDSTGTVAYTSAVTITAGTSSSCLAVSGAAATSGTATAATTARTSLTTAVAAPTIMAAATTTSTSTTASSQSTSSAKAASAAASIRTPVIFGAAAMIPFAIALMV